MKHEKKNKSFGKELFALAKKHNIDLSTVNNIQDLLKDGFKDLLEGAMKAEFDNHMGYEKHERNQSSNYRNGSGNKMVKSSFGEFEIENPRDRNGSFNPNILPKRAKDISDLEQSIINMYAMGSSTRVIVETIKDIFGFDLDPSYISKITDKILPRIEEWKTRPLKNIYPFVFIDGIRFNVREDGMGKEISCYIIIGVNLDGKKEFIGYWIGESESAKYWMTIFNEIKSRGVKRILIVSSDNLPGVSEAIKAIFPKTIIQKCVIHQIRNSIRYVNYKDLKDFTSDMKKIYKAVSIDNARQALDRFDQKWSSKYSTAIKSWRNNFDELTSFFDFPLEIRKMIYTTNVIENVNGQIRRVTKTKGSFTSVKSLEKIIFLKLVKIESKWNLPIRDWVQVINQLDIAFDLSGKYI